VFAQQPQLQLALQLEQRQRIVFESFMFALLVGIELPVGETQPKGERFVRLE
jgi:hypothetical protein